MLSKLKIEVDVLHYNGSVPDVEVVTITEMDILRLAKTRVDNTYPERIKPAEIFPTISKITFDSKGGTEHFTSEMEFVQYD